MNDPFPFPRPHVKFPSGGVTTADLPFPPSLPCLTHLPLPSVSHPHLRQIVCTVLKTAFIHLHAANATRERQCTKARLAVTASGGSRFSLGFVNLSAFSCSPKPNLLFLRLRDSVKGETEVNTSFIRPCTLSVCRLALARNDRVAVALLSTLSPRNRAARRTHAGTAVQWRWRWVFGAAARNSNQYLVGVVRNRSVFW